MTPKFIIYQFLIVSLIQNVWCNCQDGVSILPSSYPNPRRDETVQNTYGTECNAIKDPYRWMENLNSTETKKFIDEEMAITKSYLGKAPFRGELTARYKELYNYREITRFARRGNKFYSYERDVSSQQQTVIYAHDSPQDEGKIFLDPNTFSQDNSISWDDSETVGNGFSYDGLIMAYVTCDVNSDFKSIQFKHIENGGLYKEKLTRVLYSWISWTRDNKGIFYSAYPDQQGEDDGSGNKVYKNHKLYYHFLGTEQTEDIVVVEFPENPDYIIHGWVSDTGDYLVVLVSVVNSDGGDKNLIYIADLNKVNCQIKGKLELIPVVTEMENFYHYVTNTDTVFVFKTNKDAHNNKLILIDIKNPDSKTWKDFIPVNEKDILEWTSAIFEKYIVVAYTQDVKTVLQIHEIATGKMIKKLPLDIGVIFYTGFYSDKRYKDIYFILTSPLTPGIIYHCDLSNSSFELEIIKEIKLKNFDRQKYTVEQVFATSKDGTQLPMYLTYKKGLQKNGNNPVFMIGYGAFKYTQMPSFAVNCITFINNFNGIYVSSSIRGGGDYGEQWHRNGSLDRKQNTFDDFQAIAEFLITEKYTNSKLLAINGDSGSGGLLMAVCINQRPDLFGAVVADEGYYDMLRFYQLNNFTALVEEFGSPSKSQDFSYLIQYSPLHNIKMSASKQYPATMITTLDHDDSVSPAHSLKFTAELQFQAKNNPNQQTPLIIRVTKDDGSTDCNVITNNFIADLVDMMSFIVLNTGITFYAGCEE